LAAIFIVYCCQENHGWMIWLFKKFYCVYNVIFWRKGCLKNIKKYQELHPIRLRKANYKKAFLNCISKKSARLKYWLSCLHLKMKKIYIVLFFYLCWVFDCCKQSLEQLLYPSIHPSRNTFDNFKSTYFIQTFFHPF
jgi:hypothetical protein